MNSIGRLLGYVFWPLRVVFDWIGRLLPGLAKLAKISLAARIALLMFLFLTVVATSAFWFHLSQSETVKGEKWQALFYVVPLVFVIPICLYYGIKLISVKADARFPDIEKAWAHGLAELNSLQISLGETPLFLVLGSSENGPDALMEAAGIASEIPSCQEASAPLHWYASSDAIFVVVSDIGITNRLASSWTGPSVSAPQFPNESSQQPTGTIVTSFPQNDPAEQPPQQPLSAPRPAQASGVFSTLQVDSGSLLPANAGPSNTSNAGRRLQGISSAETKRQEERLRYFCELVVSARSPICPLNGMLVMLPFSLINAAGSQVNGTLRHDMQIVREVLQLRFPVVALVSEMDAEPGFHELVRRVGPELSQEQRFGKGHNHRSLPSSEQLLAVARHACGAFEDWAYMLFQQEGGLNKPGNASLFSLLCKVRGQFTDALVSVLTNAFGADSASRNRSNDHLMFAGCYFAATGPTADKQAFVRGAFQKLIDLQGELSWAPAAYEANERDKSLSNIASAIGLVGIGMTIYFFLRA